MALEPKQLDVMHRLGRAMSDPTRSALLISLLHASNYPAVLARELGLTRANVSNHLVCLRGCGLVTTEQEGRQTKYRVVDAGIIQHLSALLDSVSEIDDERTPEVCLLRKSPASNKDVTTSNRTTPTSHIEGECC
ncbi:winged helix-turn-helix transcriptional regulator [Arcanobacterium phocisimile]|uniref:Winged helix-turn-helix transcriptional regulator n=1 Tax=Arcanobacterium phocisimile TaxID=1302235 RepID=A0ABX7IHG1_9ACTO|nr:metalloregulator ArsR/SmtB family transcription factor [Arcanobacterium phocisimile]QRV02563.1 winged helix-turn-helix transcriptional regulator [Arcanobacterium phocisimile]